MMETLNEKSAVNACSKCGAEMHAYLIKLIGSGRMPPYPKYVFQIKEVCATCGWYIKFATQTDELINKFNEKFQGIKI